MRASQLRLDGSEVEHPPPETVLRAHPLTPVQDAILAAIVRDGMIRSAEAGAIVHRHRGYCGHRRGSMGSPNLADRASCCPVASSDGNEALKRLMARGLVERVRPGVWIIA